MALTVVEQSLLWVVLMLIIMGTINNMRFEVKYAVYVKSPLMTTLNGEPTFVPATFHAWRFMAVMEAERFKAAGQDVIVHKLLKDI